MSNTMRILLAVALAVIIIGVVVAFVLPNINQPATPVADTNGNNNNGNPPRNQGGPTNTPAPTLTPIPTVRLVVAVNNLPRGFKIPPNDAVAIAQWPIDVSDIPPGAIDDLELVIGKIARTDIVPGQPILRSMLAEDLSDLASFGSDAAAVLPQNNVAVAVPMDRITSVAYAIQPGDHVDVIVSLLFVDVDPLYQSIEPNQTILCLLDPDADSSTLCTFQEPIPGRPDVVTLPGIGSIPAFIAPSEAQRPRLSTQRTIQDALVVHVGDVPEDGRLFDIPATPTPIPDPDADPTPAGQGRTPQAPTPVPPRPDIIVLGVSPQDAVVLTWMVEAQLPITFALRSVRATSQIPTESVDLEYIINTFRVDIPGRFDYSIQPAITSIRQLFVGNQISLSRSSN